MGLDIAIIVIVGLFALLGLKNGLFYTLFRALGWLIAVVGALILGRSAQIFVKEHTPIYDMIFERAKEVCLSFSNQYVNSKIPKNSGMLGDGVRRLAEQAAISAAETIATAILAIIVFIVLVIAIKIILVLITRIFSKKHRKGFIGGLDGLAGMILGIVQGGIIVLILLTVFLPVSFAISPSFYFKVNDSLEHSFFAYNVYQANPIPNLVGSIRPEKLMEDISSNIVADISHLKDSLPPFTSEGGGN